VTTAILVSTIGTTFSVFLLWGFAVSLPTLWVFALVYGLSAGGYSCTWTGSIREVKKKDENADGGMIFGLLAVGRGIGCVVTGPLSEALLRRRPWAGEPMLGYGTGYLTGYGGLIVLTGVSALLGGMSWAARRLTHHVPNPSHVAPLYYPLLLFGGRWPSLRAKDPSYAF